jgi:hypothetical protein
LLDYDLGEFFRRTRRATAVFESAPWSGNPFFLFIFGTRELRPRIAPASRELDGTAAVSDGVPAAFD